MKSYNIYLDDERMPKYDGWTIVRSVDDFKKIIMKNGLPKKMSLDHDLGDNLPTGYDAVKWMVYEMEFDLRNIDINVHSANPVGAENMRKLIKSWNKFFNDF